MSIQRKMLNTGSLYASLGKNNIYSKQKRMLRNLDPDSNHDQGSEFVRNKEVYA